MGSADQIEERDDSGGDLALVDCDVHTLRIPEPVLAEKLPPRHQNREIPVPMPGYSHPHGRHIDDERFDFGDGLDPETTRERHLDAHDVDYGIVTGSTLAMALSLHPNRDFAAELARVHNEHVAEHWLPSDDRLRGSVMVAPQDPQHAAEQIHEFGTRPEFVQVIMGSSSDEAYGHPRYWPIYEAAEEHGLPVAIHTGNDGAGISSTATPGTPSTYFAWHNMLPSVYMGQVNSMVLEGVFCEYPDLRFVCVEGGIAWAPHLMWRMDKNWRSLREQAPWLEKPPSEYVREHVRFTTQPIPEPERPEHLVQIFEMMHADETVMYSGDFPHWDVDDPRLALPEGTPPETRSRIMGETAMELYDL